jgi:antiviral helicase SKI2
LTRRAKKRAKIPKRDWVHVVDINKPMKNFHELVPNMAHEVRYPMIKIYTKYLIIHFQYPFELDTFQKEAVYHLEMGDSVFVAAHTSAGKTVVAEYAIALAEKHMTRLVTLSVVLPLSKYRLQSYLYVTHKSSLESEIQRFQTNVLFIFGGHLDRRCSNQFRSHLSNNDDGNSP